MAHMFFVVLMLCCVPSCVSQEVKHCSTDAVSLLQQRVQVSGPESHPDAGVNAIRPSNANQQLIPRQLVMTGRFASIDELPLETKRNLDNTRKHTPGLTMRYLNDKACLEYLQEHFDVELENLFTREKHGSFRGDICRSAVLLREGGFYADLDFQLNVPIESLIDENTTLMTALTAHGPWETVQPATVAAKLPTGRAVSIQPILNALIAVQPRSSIMEKTIKNIKVWYADQTGQEATQGLLGPTAMAKSVAEMIQEDCPSAPLAPLPLVQGEDAMARWACGSENVRLYQEEYFGQDCQKDGEVVCPPARLSFFGLQFGVFSMGKASRESRLIGWSRFQACGSFGCGINGGEASL